MKTAMRGLSLALLLVIPAALQGQAQMSATYITKEQVDAVNALPGVDRQIISTDIGKLNLAVGIIHRGATPAAAPTAGAGNPVPAEQACGLAPGNVPLSGARGIAHNHQTETYIIVSGAGTLVTGGQIVNGRASAPESAVTTTLNGPSCSGAIGGEGVVTREVKVGDIIIIPATVPHGWLAISDHVDYLSVRPDPDRVLPDDYVHPEIEIN
ncbi:MAG: hypothetical protein WEG36_06630 [Gemmatimonadota bacterium]